MKSLYLFCLFLTELAGQNVPYPSIDTTLEDINVELSINHKERLAIIQNPNFTDSDYFENYDEVHHPEPTEKVQVAKYSSMTIFAFYVEGIGVSLLALIGKYFLCI